MFLNMIITQSVLCKCISVAAAIFDQEECVSYEEVERYYPTSGQLRPLVLIGRF